MKIGDRIVRRNPWGVILADGPIRYASTREGAREIVHWYKQLGKYAQVVRNVTQTGTVSRGSG